MYLTNMEEKIFNGEYGETLKKSMEILVALGKIYNADRLIPIKSAQISGVSYHNIGDAGLTFLQDFTRDPYIRVKVKTTLNPGGMDIFRWREMGIDEEFAKKQMEIINLFKRLGVETTLTCTPYHIGNIPSKGDHIAWAESSAVAYANSIYGAMTNRESGITALAAAIIGKTPNHGMHIKENRRPMVRIKVKTRLKDESSYGALGYIISRKIEGEIPWIEGVGKPDNESLKILSASIATYAGIPLFHIPDVTPETRDFKAPNEKIDIEDRDMDEAIKYLTDQFEDIDLVWIGCPHTSIEEIRKIAMMLRDKRINTELWITTSRRVKEEAEKMGLIKIIEESGAKVICDTCVVVSPLKNRFKNIVTNSAKACYYSRGINKFNVKVIGLRECIDASIRGRLT